MKNLACMTALVAVGLAPAIASAHMGSTKDVRLDVEEGAIQGQVEVSAVDAALALGLGLEPTAEDLHRNQALIVGWLSQGLSMSVDGRPCPAEAGPPSLVRGADPKIELPISYACPVPGGAATFRDTTVFVDDPEHRTFVTVVVDGRSTTHVLRAGEQALEIPAAPDRAGTVASFLEEGAVHLVTGYDHLLFLLSLLLVAGLTVQRRGFRPALADVTWVVTAFTVGHSVSLGAAALGYVSLPGSWVEIAIAGSIVLVAMINVLRPRTPTAATRRTRAAIAGLFGVVHGFGFSSVLAEVGLPATERVLALLAFNVGIEVAQLGVVAIALLPLGLASRHRSYRRLVVQGGSLLIAAMGCVWVVERSLAG